MFVSVIRAVRLGEGERLDDTASGQRLEHRNRLRHWVEPLRLPPARHSLHAVESPDPARTLLELARANNVDLVVIGAPGPSQRAFAWWRSVASAVTAQAPCSVYVVRVPEDDAAPDVGAGAQAAMTAATARSSSRVRSTSARVASRSSFFSSASVYAGSSATGRPSSRSARAAA